MNKIVLLGKLIKDPELKTIENGEKSFTRFIIAVDRNFKSADGTRKADLIPVTIWGRKAEVICKYMTKGSYISLSGRLRTGSYEDKEGNKIPEFFSAQVQYKKDGKTITKSVYLQVTVNDYSGREEV